MRHRKTIQSEDKVSIHDLISSKKLEEAFDVHHRTIKRLEKRYGWTPVKINDRFLRYRKSQVEDSLGISLEDPSQD